MSCPAVLIIEDEPELRDTLREVLELEGYRVDTAGNGAEGLALLEQISRPCLVLLDLMMPVMDGWQFLEHMAGREARERPPVAVVSAAADLADVGRRFACEVVRKPVDIERLLAVVQQHCMRDAG